MRKVILFCDSKIPLSEQFCFPISSDGRALLYLNAVCIRH